MQCEICNKNRILESHHIKSRSKGGKDTKSNKCDICSNCHKLIHYGLLIVEGRFDCTSGNIVIWRKLGEESITGFSDPEVYIVPGTEDLRENYRKRLNNDNL